MVAYIGMPAFTSLEVLVVEAADRWYTDVIIGTDGPLPDGDLTLVVFTWADPAGDTVLTHRVVIDPRGAATVHVVADGRTYDHGGARSGVENYRIALELPHVSRTTGVFSVYAAALEDNVERARTPEVRVHWDSR